MDRTNAEQKAGPSNQESGSTGSATDASSDRYLNLLRCLENTVSGSDNPSTSADNETGTNRDHRYWMNMAYNEKFDKELSKAFLDMSNESLGPDLSDGGKRQRAKKGGRANEQQARKARIFFNYILLDSDVTRNLPRQATYLSMPDVWCKFLSAVFYIGKGTCNKQLDYLYDARDVQEQETGISQRSKERREKILSIWDGKGSVISLCVFQNATSIEASIREILMNEVLMNEVPNKQLANKICDRWEPERRRIFGTYLLYKAMRIFLLDGERPILRANLKPQNELKKTDKKELKSVSES